MIRRAVFGWLKIPEPKTNDRVEKEIASVSPVKVKQDEVDAWVAAGMPSPPNVFFESYRRQKAKEQDGD